MVSGRGLSKPDGPNRLTMVLRRYFERSPIPIRTVFLWAVLLAVLYVITAFIGRTGMGRYPERFDWLGVAPIPFLNFLTWALLVPLVNIILSRWPLVIGRMLPQVLVHLALGLLLGAVQEVFTNVIYISILAYAERFVWTVDNAKEVLISLPGGVLQRTMEYWVLLVLLMYARSNKQVAEKRTQPLELENKLQEAELNSLKKQLQPHFLFNALNTVSSLMEEDVEAAQDVLIRLGQLLRTTLDESRLDQVPLLHELDTASHYLAIEAVRYKDRLQVVYTVSNDCHDAIVPNLILQPLVENSVKHGVSGTSEPVRVEVKAWREADRIRLAVIDDGRGCPDVEKALTHGGIGLRNVQQRVKLIYGENGSFRVMSPGGQGFQVHLELPYEAGTPHNLNP